MVVAIIQARMGSTRLPKKVLKDICGHPMLWHVINRVRMSRRIDKAVVATTELSEDDLLAEKCQEWEIDVFRGSAEDLLDRYYNAAVKFSADPIVRITGDCPLIDPMLIDMVVESYVQLGRYDSVALDIATFPDGLDTRIFSFKALQKTYKQAELPSDKENIISYMRNHPELFRLYSIPHKEDLSHIRLTVDEEKDLIFVRKIFKRLAGPKDEEPFYLKDIIKLLKEEPSLLEINSNIQRDQGYLKALDRDREYLKKQRK